MAEKNKVVTVRDLQTFIDAVEFASDQEEWVPSAKQWKRIRQMIDDLDEAPAPVPAPVQQPVYHQPAPIHHAPSGFGQGPANPTYSAPVQTSLPPLFGTGGAVPARTPDIDTTNGQYSSSFA